MAVKVKRTTIESAAIVKKVRSVPQHRPHVKYVTCDVDGTLLNSKHNVDPRVEAAVIDTLACGVKFVCASGKSRQGVLNSVGPTIEEHLRKAYGGQVPGIFLNGLIVYGLNGEIVYEKTVPESTSWKIVNKARELGMTLVAYNEDRILCEKFDAETEKLRPYKEPHPEPIGKWENVIGKVPLHKFMFLAPVEECRKYRGEIDILMEGEAKVTQAIPDMIEILPGQGSKGAGVEMFLDSFGGKFENLLALGDAENDLEMMEMAKYGVAMGNAMACLKKVAKDVTKTNDEAGVAHALNRYVLRNNSLNGLSSSLYSRVEQAQIVPSQKNEKVELATV
mmetsp:Transcript_12009/g.17380  ORF Transcript_12009/g.17380 Transcript_12009/m.17380 type:complete len:335 (-) Transcript_12009:168-1172(-)